MGYVKRGSLGQVDDQTDLGQNTDDWGFGASDDQTANQQAALQAVNAATAAILGDVGVDPELFFDQADADEDQPSQ